LEAQKQKAMEVKERMNAQKAAAAKEIAAAIEARNAAMKKEDIPRAADLIAKWRQMGKEALDARKPAGGPSEVQKALEQEREALKMRIQEHKATIPKTPEKDHKYTKDDNRGRDAKLKSYGAVDQLSKESELKKQEKMAEKIRDAQAAKMHYNRK
jgi:hypothetical protein